MLLITTKKVVWLISLPWVQVSLPSVKDYFSDQLYNKLNCNFSHMWHLRWWWKWHLIVLVILCLMNCFRSVCSVGFPRKLWQRHAQKKCDRPAHLRSPSPDPSLVMVWQNHDACRDTGLHRGRLTPGPVQFLYPIPLPSRAPLPPCYTGASQPVFQYELCNLYKEIDLQWFFSRIRVQWWWVAVCCFVVFVQLFKPAPVSLVFWLLLFF